MTLSLSLPLVSSSGSGLPEDLSKGARLPLGEGGASTVPAAPAVSSGPVYKADFSTQAVQGEVRKIAGNGVTPGEVSEKTGALGVLDRPVDSKDLEEPLGVQAVTPTYGRGDSDAAGSLREGGGVEVVKSGNPVSGPDLNGRTTLKTGAVSGSISENGALSEGDAVALDSLEPSPELEPESGVESHLDSSMVDPDGKVTLHGARGNISLRDSKIDPGVDPLDELDPTDVANSGFAPEFLRSVILGVNTDKGLRTALDKRLGIHISRERRKVWNDESIKLRDVLEKELLEWNAEAREEIQREVQRLQEERSEIETSIARAAEKVRDEERAKARADLGAKMSEGRGARNLDQLKSVT